MVHRPVEEGNPMQPGMPEIRLELKQIVTPESKIQVKRLLLQHFLTKSSNLLFLHLISGTDVIERPGQGRQPGFFLQGIGCF
jgi:hypothetical protein